MQSRSRSISMYLQKNLKYYGCCYILFSILLKLNIQFFSNYTESLECTLLSFKPEKSHYVQPVPQTAMYFAVFPTRSPVHSLYLFPNIHSFDSFKSLKCLLGFWFSLSFPHRLQKPTESVPVAQPVRERVWQNSCDVLIPGSQLQ